MTRTRAVYRSLKANHNLGFLGMHSCFPKSERLHEALMLPWILVT